MNEKPCPMCMNEAHCIITGNPCFNTRKSLCDALKKAYERGYRTMIHTERYDDCHIWEPGDKLDTISDKCEVLIKATDVKALVARPANDRCTAARPIDANILYDEISRLQIFLAGESLFTPAIKETVLRTIDEQATVAVSQPANEPLTLEQLREMDGEPVWTVGVSHTDDGSWSMWDIIEDVNDEGITFGYSTEHCDWWNYNLRGADGKLCGCAWIAYRRKPERSENDAKV